MRTWPRARWYPPRRAKIRLADIGMGDRIEVYLGRCPACGGQGGVWTRSSFDPEFDRPHECRQCSGTGTSERSHFVAAPDRPRSRYRMIIQWRDPATGIVHARMWPPRKHARDSAQQRLVPSCAAGARDNNGLPRLRLRDWSVDLPVTCEACQLVVERCVLAAAGVPPLPERADLAVDP